MKKLNISECRTASLLLKIQWLAANMGLQVKACARLSGRERICQPTEAAERILNNF
jgi:hypothetical protein